MDALDLRGGAEAVWALVATANLFIQQVAPWSLAKQGKEAELDACLAALARVLYRLAVLSSPFIPGKAQLLWRSLGLAGEAARTPWESLIAPPVAGRRTSKPENLFPKPAVV
jgi:methionyl-tRNA synthetase